MTDAIEVAVTSELSRKLWSMCAWDLHTGTQLMSYKGNVVCAKNCVQLLNSEYVIAAERSKPLLHVWPINSMEPKHDFRSVLPGILNALAVSNDSCYIVGGIEENIYIWDVESGALLSILRKHYDKVTCIRFSSQGGIFVTAADDCTIMIWSLADVVQKNPEYHKPLHSFVNHTLPINDICVGVGGRIYSASSDGSCNIYDMASKQLLASLKMSTACTALCTDVAETAIFIGTKEGIIVEVNLREPPRKLHHLSEEEKKCKFSGHTDEIVSLSASQDASTLLSSSDDQSVRLWHIQSRQCLRILPHQGKLLNAFITLTPPKMFHKELLPEINVHRLSRNQDSADVNVKITLKEDLIDHCPRGSSSIYLENSTEGEEVPTDNRAFERMKQLNYALFKFATEKILNKDETGVSEEEPGPLSINVAAAVTEIRKKTREMVVETPSKDTVKSNKRKKTKSD